jgi:hypothetical protein
MELAEIKEFIEGKFKKGLPTNIFLSKMRLVDEEAKQSFAYNDQTYIPFYYWLGTLIAPKTMVEIGFRLGLLSANFLKSCKTVEQFIALQEVSSDEYYSARLGRGNIKDNYKKYFYIHVGDVADDVFVTKVKALEIDFAIVNEETTYDRLRGYFDLIWPQISKGGLMVCDHLNREKVSAAAFKDFCITVNLEPTYINTTYGVGLIRKV